jgi:hypothetical protein
MRTPGKTALAGLLQFLLACGGSEPQIEKTPACTEEHRVRFADLPSGLLTKTIVDHITIQPRGGDAHVQLVKEEVVLLLVDGEVGFLPDCQASSVEMIYNDTEAQQITIDLYSSPFGGKVLLSENSQSLDAIPLKDGYQQATVETPDGEATVELFIIGGGAGGKDPTSTLVREVIVR